MTRRKLLLLAWTACTMTAATAVAAAAPATDFPERPITMIVPFPPGGSTDVLGRLVAQELSQALGQTVIVDNRAGAAGNIGVNEASRAKPDGYTIVIAGGANAINATLYKKLPFDFVRDLTPVGLIGIVQNVMVVRPDFPATTPAEFVTHAQAQPGKLNYASSGNGATTHMAAELFKSVTGTDMVHVPYKGSSPALVDLVGGQVDVMFDSIVSSAELAKSGRLRALAVTGPSRSAALPDVPTLQESGIDVDAVSFFGVFAPAATPLPIVERYNEEIRKIVAKPEISHRLLEMGAEPKDLDVPAFAAFTKGEVDKWAEVVRFSGATAD